MSHNTIALERLLGVFSVGTLTERLELTRVVESEKNFYSDALDLSSRLLENGSSAFRAFTTISFLTRIIWSLVPNKLLTSPSPDFKNLAKLSIENKFGNVDNIDALSKNLSIIFKRIRQYSLDGRSGVTSLNLSSTKHQLIFNRQNGRCNHCLFEFGNNLSKYYSEDEGVIAVPYISVKDEIVLDKTYRQPELDHIVPLVLGGDGPDNWQILCKTCNAGKSDLVNYMYIYASQSSNRYSQLIELSSGKRYSIISEYRIEDTDVAESDGSFYRIFKRDDNGLYSPDNLYAKYC
jgi:hypothetical protein